MDKGLGKTPSETLQCLRQSLLIMLAYLDQESPYKQPHGFIRLFAQYFSFLLFVCWFPSHTQALQFRKGILCCRLPATFSAVAEDIEPRKRKSVGIQFFLAQCTAFLVLRG